MNPCLHGMTGVSSIPLHSHCMQCVSAAFRPRSSLMGGWNEVTFISEGLTIEYCVYIAVCWCGWRCSEGEGLGRQLLWGPLQGLFSVARVDWDPTRSVSCCCYSLGSLFWVCHIQLEDCPACRWVWPCGPRWTTHCSVDGGVTLHSNRGRLVWISFVYVP